MLSIVFYCIFIALVFRSKLRSLSLQALCYGYDQTKLFPVYEAVIATKAAFL